jgi:threonine synthase
VDAFCSGKDLVPSETNTLADSIAVGTPLNWRRAIKQMKASNGDIVTVTDEEILEAMRMTARLAGVFGEPAGITGVAGLKKAIDQGIVKSNESALVVITGNGLKDVTSAKQAAGEVMHIEPNIDALSNALPALSLSKISSQS